MKALGWGVTYSLLQLRVLGFGFFQDGDVGVVVFPETRSPGKPRGLPASHFRAPANRGPTFSIGALFHSALTGF